MIKVKFFSDFKIEYGDRSIGDSLIKSKKYLSLLEFLAMTSNKNYPKESLMDLLWDNDKSTNPSNALKTAIHRIRNVLDLLEHPEEIIIQSNNTYKWNPDIPTVYDIFEFEKYAKIIHNKELSNEERLDAYHKASELYTGDFLEKTNTQPWIIPTRTYYRSIFTNITYEVIHILEQTQDYTEAEKIAEKACLIDPYDESMHYCLVKSRIKQGKRNAATEHYNYTVNLFHEKFDVSPTPEFIALYREITAQTHVESFDLIEIQSKLKEEPNKKAFFCNYEIFKDMYQFKARVLTTKKEDSYIYLVTLKSEISGTVNDAAGEVKRYLIKNLSISSVITRYSKSQFLIMILNEPKEVSETKLNKILDKFKMKHYPPPSDLSFEISGRLIEAATEA